MAVDVLQRYRETDNQARLPEKRALGKDMGKVVEVGLYIATAAFLGLAGYALYLDRTASGTVAVVAALGCLFVSKLDVIEHIKLLGLEATMKKTISEAQATLEQLQKLSVAQGTALIEILYPEGRPAHTRKRKEEIKETVLESLRILKLGEEAIEAVRRTARPAIQSDYASHLMTAFWSATQRSGDRTLWQEFAQTIQGRDLYSPPTPEMFADFAGALPLAPDAWIFDIIEDYRHYRATGRHRRPDAYFDRYRPHLSMEIDGPEVAGDRAPWMTMAHMV